MSFDNGDFTALNIGMPRPLSDVLINTADMGRIEHGLVALGFCGV